MHKYALFINGIFESVIKEIIRSQEKHPDFTFFIQPYKSHKIKNLAKNQPSKDSPIKLYISTTIALNKVAYMADIVNWEEKQKIPSQRLDVLNKFIKQYQPGEEDIYMSANSKKCVNLISIINLKSVTPPFSVSKLIKTGNGESLSVNRSRSGGWSYVYELPENLFNLQLMDKAAFDRSQEQSIDNSRKLTAEERKKRLSSAPKFPEQIQIVSTTYKRNPDVYAEVMFKANGTCARCKSKAPFLRATDNSPYLEMHHWIPLSKGGEDTVKNAGAVCPNCHRELHFGRIIAQNS